MPVWSLIERFYPYVAAFTLLLSVTVWIHHRGYAACQADQMQQALKQEKEHAQIEAKIMLLPDVALRCAEISSVAK